MPTLVVGMLEVSDKNSAYSLKNKAWQLAQGEYTRGENKLFHPPGCLPALLLG
jgi:hypothetical protein